MLNPDTRHLLSDALRPPPGMTFDAGFITTFSADLDAAMAVPLTLARFDNQRDDASPDLVAMLEAMRRASGKLTIVCQAGQIKVPGSFMAITTALEDMISEASAPSLDFVFHPKLWVLRFTDGHSKHLRLLCMSRNLTFDRSWDAVLRLESTQIRGRTVATSRPIADFIRDVVKLAPAMTRRAKENAADIADDVRRAEWELPEGVNELKFLPIGTGANHWPFPQMNRSAIVSPFLTAGFLRRFRDISDWSSQVISRTESLDQMPLDLLDQFSPIEVVPQIDGVTDEPTAEVHTGLQGLHAKVFAGDIGWDSRVWVGSANATDAAFGGNIEFLVQLSGGKRHLAVDKLLGGPESRTQFLEPYARARDEIVEPDDGTEREMERYGREFAQLGFTMSVEAVEEEFDLRLASREAVPATDMDIRVRPVSLGAGLAFQVVPGKRVDASFGRRTFNAISSFVAVELNLRGKSTQFVVNAELVGAPDDRSERVLAALLDDPDKLLRYLLLMLSDDETAGHLASAGGGQSSQWIVNLFGSVTPFELMVKAFHRRPDRIDELADVVRRIREQKDGDQRFPADFFLIWDAVVAARQTT